MHSESRFLAAQTFAEFLESAQANADLWRGMYQRVRVPESFVQRVQALRNGEGAGAAVRRHLLVLNADWCGDAVNTVPIIARLAELADNLDLRVLDRDRNPDLMDAHLTGTSRSIPVVMVLDEHYRECGWWGPRPVELQRWVLGPGQALEKTERYREVRRWYARDQGLTTLEDVVGLLERCAATRAAG